jgi:hypothetical protein
MKVRTYSSCGFGIEIELIPLSLACYELAIYDHVDGSVLVAQGLS